jgi:mannose-6-phosphate isomerase-like protein (cupin superfamily)
VRPYTPLSDALSDLSVLAESVRGSALLSVATSPKLGRRARRLDPPEPVDDLLAFTVAQLSAGVEDIRSLVNRIYPPALATSALGATLTDLARPGGVVDVHTVLNRRSDPVIEATAWFVASEGIANAVKHAPGHRVRVSATSDGDRTLTVSIVDVAGQDLEWIHGGLFTILLDSKATEGQLTVGRFDVPKDEAPPFHLHTREDEVFLLIKGTALVWGRRTPRTRQRWHRLPTPQPSARRSPTTSG